MKQPSSSNAEFDRLAEFILEDGSSTSLSSGPAASPAFLTTRSALSLMELWSCSPPEAPLAFLRFHHRHGQSTALVTAVVRNEVANLQSTNLLLRESSIGSVLLAHLMELEAEDYLNATLGPFVKEVIREKKGFEVESFWEEDEEARQQNVEKLKDMCQLFLDTFEKSIPQFPNPLRAVLREVATATAQRFPDMPKEEVMRCTVASIVFLRFVCPGLVAYKIKGSEVLPKARGLVLISKVMLTLASGQEFTKKDWLPLNSFIKENQRRMLQLCESLIKVEGEEITAPREEQRRSIRKSFFGSPRGRSSGEIDFPVDEEKELATIFDFFVQHESKMKDALRTQTFTQKKATPRLNTKEDPWIDSFMKCWIADDFIKFDAELMEYVDNGDPNFSKVPVPEAPSSPKEKESCCSADETTVLKGEAVVIDAETLTEAEEEFVQQKFEQLIKVLNETSEALKRQDSRIPAAYDANENDNKRKSPRSASSSSSEALSTRSPGSDLDNITVGPICDPVEYQTSLDWFQEERRHHKFSILLYHKGMWCPFCRSYIKVWNRFVEPCKEMGGAIFSMCSMSQEAASKEAQDNKVSIPSVGDPGLSLFTFYGGDFLKAKQLGRSFSMYVETKAYPTKKMAKPAIFVVGTEGEVLYSWTPAPNRGNFFGNRDRPHPKDILRMLRDRA